MYFLLWCKEITLVLLIGVSCNANKDCKTISTCEMDCDSRPKYRCNNRGIIEVPSFPEATVEIDVSDNTIRTLNSDTFADNSIVYGIDLSNNTLTSIPDAVFKNNVALKFLNLSNNFLASIPVDVFMYNTVLEIIDLSNNTITSLPDGVFKNNVALAFLDLSYNSLTSLSDEVFRNNVALTYLLLRGNSLTTLALDLFSSNVGLITLNLAWNMYTNLSDELFANNKQLRYVYITGNPIDNIETHVFDNNNNITSLEVDCSNCFDCDCLSISTYKWITKRVTDLQRYNFTCRNGISLPNAVFNCSELSFTCKSYGSLSTLVIYFSSPFDGISSFPSRLYSHMVSRESRDYGLRLAVTTIYNESSCNCKDSTTPAIESTSGKVQHTTKTKDSSYTSTALVISGMAASITIITAFIVLRKFIETTSRIKQSRMTDTEHNNTISDGIDFIKTIDWTDGQMGKKYNNIPPISHIQKINDGIGLIKTFSWNGKMGKECHIGTIHDESI